MDMNNNRTFPALLTPRSSGTHVFGKNQELWLPDIRVFRLCLLLLSTPAATIPHQSLFPIFRLRGDSAIMYFRPALQAHNRLLISSGLPLQHFTRSVGRGSSKRIQDRDDKHFNQSSYSSVTLIYSLPIRSSISLRKVFTRNLLGMQVISRGNSHPFLRPHPFR